MDPVTIVGISLASILVGEALLVKVYKIVTKRNREPEVVSSQVLDTT